MLCWTSAGAWWEMGSSLLRISMSSWRWLRDHWNAWFSFFIFKLDLPRWSVKRLLNRTERLQGHPSGWDGHAIRFHGSYGDDPPQCRGNPELLWPVWWGELHKSTVEDQYSKQIIQIYKSPIYKIHKWKKTLKTILSPDNIQCVLWSGSNPYWLETGDWEG